MTSYHSRCGVTSHRQGDDVNFTSVPVRMIFENLQLKLASETGISCSWSPSFESLQCCYARDRVLRREVKLHSIQGYSFNINAAACHDSAPPFLAFATLHVPLSLPHPTLPYTVL